MVTQENPEEKQINDPCEQQIKLLVEPGAKVEIIVDAGKNIVDGKVPLTIRVAQVAAGSLPVRRSSGLSKALDWAKRRLKIRDLATWLFIFAIAVYLITRLIGLTQFPLYFFTDEAIQSQSMIDLVKNGYRDPSGILFPTYFRNGEYYNLSLSVYMQWLPYLLFGKSAVVTRAASVFITLIAAASIGLILRNVFKIKYWWTGTLFLSITPAWFLHSRTAFETAEFVAFYAGALCAYLFYRYKSPRYLYLALVLGALAFYSYSPAQLLVPFTALGLLISDWRYHWQNRRTALLGLVLIAVLALPYLRFRSSSPNTPFSHLHTLFSYWTENIPFSEKIARYLSEYGIGLSPWYWYIPNVRDLSRHLMKDYGNIALFTLPFALLGLVYVLRNVRESACRVILIALLVSPASGALVQISITRVLSFVIPIAILTALGLEQVLLWIEDPAKRLAELGEGDGPSRRRRVAALLILLIGIPIALIYKETANRLVISTLALILALQASGILERFARRFTRSDQPLQPKLWKSSPTFLALLAFVALSGTNVYMLSDALRNGPLWFRDYGMGGMQYGAFQIFDLVKKYVEEHPDTQVILSPDWANGTDVVARFFLGDSSPVRMGSVRGHITQKLPLDDHTLFIITPDEFDLVRKSPKFKEVKVETIVPYPDGKPGFYFIHLQYVDNIDEIFAKENAARQVLREGTFTIDGQKVKVRYPYLDTDFQYESMALVFDNDPYTVAKTFESNPFVMEMVFPAPRALNGFSIIIGSANVQITLKCFPESNAEPVVYTFDGQGTRSQPELSFDLPKPTQAKVLRVEVLDPLSPEQSKIHIWELKLR